MNSLSKNSANEDKTIDLHGMTCNEAQKFVENILESSRTNERILIIHGKGTGILKDHIRKFLYSHSKVKNVLLGEKEKFQGKSGVCLIIIN